MTVLTTTAFTGPYFPNGATVFPFDFRAASASEIMVVRRPLPPNRTGPDVVIGGYSVELSPTGGNVVFGTPPLAGDPLYILSNPSLQQQTNFASQGNWSPTAVNAALDKAAIRDIYLKYLISCCLRSTDPTDPLPSAGGRLGTVLGFNQFNGLRELLTYDELAVWLADPVTVIWRQETQADRDLASAYAAQAGTYLDTIRTLLGTTSFSGTLAVQALTRAEIASFSGMSAGKEVYLGETGKIGLWVWDASNRSTDVTLDPYQGLFVAPASAPTGASGAWVRRVDDDCYLASWWGPPKDGTDAAPIFESISNIISSRGGGRVRLERGVVYSVGAYVFNGPTPVGTGYRFAPKTAWIFNFVGCTAPVELDLNGAELRCVPGLYYGTFNNDGTPLYHDLPYFGVGISTPYFAMVRAQGCSGPVTIKNGELNGNILNTNIGGGYGDSSWQIAMTGISIEDCSGAVKISNINSHHHGEDGISTKGVATSDESPDECLEIEDSQFECNGRQGWSLVRGKGVRARRSKFNWTGKGVRGSDTLMTVRSAPGAGIDIECESGVIRDVFLEDCQCMGNLGPGVLVYGGDTKGVQMLRTLLVGTTSWAAVLTGPGIELDFCTVVGAMANAWPGDDLALSTKFRRLKAYAGPARSPTGTVYLPGFPVLFEFGGLGSQNILFEDYLIDTEDNPTAILGGAGSAVYRNGSQTQSRALGVIIDGHYEGRNVVTTGAPVVLSAVFNTGDLTVNGTSYPTSVAGDLAVAQEAKAKLLKANTVGGGLDGDAEPLVVLKTDWAVGGYKSINWTNAGDTLLADAGVLLDDNTNFVIRVPNFASVLTEFFRVNALGIDTPGSGYHISGTKVVGAQEAAIDAPTGGTVADAEARAVIGTILFALRNHGLIAS